MEARLFKIDDRTDILCEVYTNSRHWGHRGTLLRDGLKVASTTITYYNRTWESYQFETVLRKVIWKSCLYSEEEMDGIMKEVVGY